MTTNEADTSMATGTDTAAAAATGAGAPKTADTTDAGGSLLDGLFGNGAAAAKPLSERIPEKYRVNGADGKLDEQASMAKLLDGYDHLSKKLGSAAETAPATPADYKLELLGADGKPREDVDLEKFAADPLFQGIAKGAHEQGITNKQLNWMVGQYLELAPTLVAADAELTLDEAKTELKKLWPDDASFGDGIKSALRAMKGYGGEAEDMPGSFARLESKYGRDPDFMAFAAAIGKELKEDKPAATDSVGGVGEGDIEALMKTNAYRDKSDPAYAETNRKVREYFDRKYGTAPKR